MNTQPIREKLRALAVTHRKTIVAAVVLIVLGFWAGAVFAHDRPAPPAPVVVEPAYPHQSRCIDKWKCDHFVGSAIGGVLFGRAIDEDNKWRWAEREIGCGLTCQRWAACLAPGVAKELYDQRRWRTGSWVDMAANTLGCALGLHLSTTF